MTMPESAAKALQPLPDPGHDLNAPRNVSASRLAARLRPEMVGGSELRASSADSPEASNFILEVWRPAMAPCVRKPFSPNIGQTSCRTRSVWPGRGAGYDHTQHRKSRNFGAK